MRRLFAVVLLLVGAGSTQLLWHGPPDHPRGGEPTPSADQPARPMIMALLLPAHTGVLSRLEKA